MLISKTLNPSPPLTLTLTPFSNPLTKTPKLFFKPPKPTNAKPLRITSHFHPSPPRRRRRDLRAFGAKRDKTRYKARESAAARIESNTELRRELRRRARGNNKKLAESLFYRLKNPHDKGNYPDNFSEDELQEIGLGYDRLVRFMDKDDPNLRHPYDWYKYGQYGPYSWRGVVVGDPVRGRFSDERVAMISEVRDAEEWEKIEQFDMAQKFGKRLDAMDRTKFRYYWVFVRHPRWRLSELPWEQWTLVSEVVLEAGNQRLDKWSLMGRLGSATRSLIGKCAAWMRPDIIYVKKPVFQCRFEPQDNFFRSLMPFLDPRTENDYLFELEDDDGNVELVTYYGGLCKIVKVNQKAFVDDVVKGYEKLSDEKKSECLKFLLGNHPVHLLHPYTKEWKAKLEEMELGCDAPDEDEEKEEGDAEIVDWIEEEDGDEGGDELDEDDNVVMEMDGDDEDEGKEEDEDEDEEEKDAKYWDEEFRKALYNSEAMEKLAKKSVEVTTDHYNKQLAGMQRTVEKKKAAATTVDLEEEDDEDEDEDEEEEEDAEEEENVDARGDGDETELRGKRAKVSPEEWKIAGIGPWRRRIKKSRIPPELFLRAAVRLFTYRNLVKEIVLTRHAILDGDINLEDKIL